MKAPLAILILLAVISLALGAQVGEVTIHALAVDSQGVGHVIDIAVKRLPFGSGRVYVAAVPETGEGFGPSAQVASYVASILSGLPPTNYTFLIDVKGSEVQVGGPSASAYLAVAMYALLNNLGLRNDTVMTGMILPDGLVGPVGGVRAKVLAAREKGFKRVLVPAGQGVRVPGVDVIEVLTVEDAVRELTNRAVEVPRVSYEDLITQLYLSITKALFDGINSKARSILGAAYSRYIDERALREHLDKGDYYTSANIVFDGLRRYYADMLRSGRITLRDIVLEARRKLGEYLGEVEGVEVTTANIDVLVAIYDRILDLSYLLNKTSLTTDEAVALMLRALTIEDWINVLKSIRGGEPIPKTLLSNVAELYREYAKALLAYITSIQQATVSVELMSFVEEMQDYVDIAFREYNRGNYPLSLASSLTVISRVTAVLATTPAVGASVSLRELADAIRLRALQLAYRASRCGGLNTLPLSYVQYGDYFMSAGSTTSAIGNYEYASSYASALYIVLSLMGCPTMTEANVVLTQRGEGVGPAKIGQGVGVPTGTPRAGEERLERPFVLPNVEFAALTLLLGILSIYSLLLISRRRFTR